MILIIVTRIYESLLQNHENWVLFGHGEVDNFNSKSRILSSTFIS